MEVEPETCAPLRESRGNDVQYSLRAVTLDNFDRPPIELTVRAIIVVEPPPLSPFMAEDLAPFGIEVIDERCLTFGAELWANWRLGFATVHNHRWLLRLRGRDWSRARRSEGHD
jgi:hypothetical protein